MHSPKPDRDALRGKIAVITGAVGVLGREHCQALASAGASVVVADFDRRSCESLARELERFDVPTLAVPTDITDEASVQRLGKAAAERFRAVDVLVNDSCAEDDLATGTSERSGFEDLPLERWRRMLDINVTGTFLCCRVLGAEMARRGMGAIVNASSKRAVVTAPAVLALSHLLAEHWERSGVRVNTIASGSGTLDEYRRALVFLASDASAGLTGFDLVVKAEHGF